MRLTSSFLLILMTLVGSGSLFAQSLKSPAEFLGYSLGERFTSHHHIVDYFQHLDEQSDKLTLKEIGKSYGGRPLLLATITSEKNQSNIEAIRLNNLKRTGLETGSPDASLPALTWLSYNVHGNEAVSSEAAMQTAYDLLTGKHQSDSWLDNTVVLMDPCLNPDGRERYVQWYQSVVGFTPNPDPISREHFMPWPGGRSNHYYFDMNRDWAWQTQRESQARTKEYQQWMPQVHVDFHEQGYDSPYYFAPAAEPMHVTITPWQREFQQIIGKNHMGYFDEEGWLYFTSQRFDLLYPSYGDTWPTFNGAIGMTYEQGGIRAGLAIVTQAGDTLTLKDRIEHHVTTGLSTVEAVSQNKDRAITEFERYFDQSVNRGVGEYAGYLLLGALESEKGLDLVSYLTRQRISFGVVNNGERFSGYHYHTGEIQRGDTPTGTVFIPSKQPKAHLVRVLMDPKPQVTDSLTYDITAWALPYVYGVEAVAVNKEVKTTPYEPKMTPGVSAANPATYALLMHWDDGSDAQFLAHLLKENIKVRFTEVALTVQGKSYAPGSLLILKADNPMIGKGLESTLIGKARAMGKSIITLTSGHIPEGADLGSSDIRVLKSPKILVATGDDVSSYSAGEVWHYFDQYLEYPVTLVNIEQLSRAQLHRYDVLVLPNGSYSTLQSTLLHSTILPWIRKGGKVVAIQNALQVFETDGLVKKVSSKKDTVDYSYGDRERQAISEYVPGAIFTVTIDHTHPLGYGYDGNYATLKLNGTTYQPLKEGWNVSVLNKKDYRSGFVGYKKIKELDRSLLFGVQSKGQGSVVYLADNPLFRAFWQEGKLLFANAVFMVGN